jgi:hypothetical protein
MDVRQLVGLLGGKRAASGFVVGHGIRGWEEFGRHEDCDAVQFVCCEEDADSLGE